MQKTPCAHHELSGKAADGIQTCLIRKEDHQFLHAYRLIGRYTLAKRIGGANEAIIYSAPAPRSHRAWNQSLGLLVGITNNAERC